jgi:vanillate O-demethylase monooxygenase subunit
LAHGRLIGDTVACGYHGITFDGAGRCTRIPSQDKIPDSMAVRSYAVHEVGGLVWIWMGSPGATILDDMPDVSKVGIAAPGFRHEFNPVRHLAARYQLLIDNLMDLSHISFIHEKTVPDGGYIAEADVQITQDSGVFSVRRKFTQVPPDGFVKFLHPDIEGNVDNTLTSDYFGPALINAGGPYLRKPGEDWDRQMNFIHAITPETPHSTHYFNGVSRNFALDNHGLSQMLLGQSAAVIAEDIHALELLETRLQAGGGDRKEVSVLNDAGALQVRRLLAAQIQAELEGKGGLEPTKRPSVARA